MPAMYLDVFPVGPIQANCVLLGDPAGSAATATKLLAADWLDRRAASVDRLAATPSAAPDFQCACGKGR